MKTVSIVFENTDKVHAGVIRNINMQSPSLDILIAQNISSQAVFFIFVEQSSPYK